METDKDWDPASMQSNQLEKELKSFWGLKLGKDNSKEANTINWVYGALSDFNGYLQARDVVRFLEQAAKASGNHISFQVERPFAAALCHTRGHERVQQ